MISSKYALVTLSYTDMNQTKWKRGPDMPVGLYGHSVVVSEKQDILVILGGRRPDDPVSDVVYIMDKNFEFHEVGQMENYRMYGIAEILEE